LPQNQAFGLQKLQCRRSRRLQATARSQVLNQSLIPVVHSAREVLKEHKWRSIGSVSNCSIGELDALCRTGLRVSELLALRWSDVDFENLELRVTRSIWHQVVGNCKTEASAKPVPMDSYMAEDLSQLAPSEYLLIE
jgi:integrase